MKSPRLARDIQAKLLRAIEHHEITPIGSDKPQSVDVRIVSASNENLNDAIAASRFREDLFYRLSTVVIDLPNLRSRRDDIVLLMQHFLTHYAALYETTAPQLDAEEIATLLAHDWPGNVRELRNVAERRVLAARRGGGSIATSMRLENDMGNVPETLREAVASFERSLIAKAIQTPSGAHGCCGRSAGYWTAHTERKDRQIEFGQVRIALGLVILSHGYSLLRIGLRPRET